MPDPDPTLTEREVRIVYTNWKGDTRLRRLRPVGLWWGKTEWHPEEQWLLRAIDLEDPPDSNAKDFALLGFKGRE